MFPDFEAGLRFRLSLVFVVLLGALFSTLVWPKHDLTFTPSGAFRVEGEYPSTEGHLAKALRWGSWTSKKSPGGTLTSEPFVAPSGLVLVLAGYPNHSGQSLELVADDNRTERARLDVGPDPREMWTPTFVWVPDSWRGRRVVLVVSSAEGVDAWIGVSDARAARFDELLLARGVSSLWNYVGFAYLLLVAFVTSRTLRIVSPPTNRLVYWVACAAVTLLAYTTGWNSVDLSGYFATWGRDALAYGASGLYEAPWHSDNPPLNPTIMVVPAFLEALLRADDARLSAFLYKLLPLASLFVLPLLLRVMLIVTKIRVTQLDFRNLVLCTITNPALIYSCALWGQSDVYVMDLVLLSFISYRIGRSALGTGVYFAAALTKPQAILAAPVVLAFILASKRWAQAAAAAIFSVLLVLPSTFPHGGIFAGYLWLFNLYSSASSEYHYAAIGSGTLPGILSGDGLVSDLSPLFGLTIRTSSYIAVFFGMVAISIAAIAERGRLKSRIGIWYLAVSCMAIYWLAPHMHSRYITYAAIAAIGWAFARKGALATISAVFFSIALMLQMMTNWNVDLGFHADIMGALTHILPHSTYFQIYAALNVFGLAALLLSRRTYDSDKIDVSLRAKRPQVSSA